MNGIAANPLRILAVDDEKGVRNLYRDVLSFPIFGPGFECDFDVVLCAQGDEALDEVKKANDRDKPFAVAFLDLNLPPGPDGIWTGEEIRNLDSYINFVIVTGMLDIDPREIVRRIPPEDKLLYIQKPLHIQELRQFAVALGSKWQSEILLRKTNDELEKKVKELEKSRKNLISNKSELENVNNELLETNDALSVLARNLDRARKESEKRIIERTRSLITPIIERLHNDRGMEKYRTDLNLLAGFIGDLTSDLTSDTKIAASLSTTELRIASMIRTGMSSEEIAGHQYISLSTVKTHRKNIRKKLNLRNSRTNLKTYLQNEMDE